MASKTDTQNAAAEAAADVKAKREAFNASYDGIVSRVRDLWTAGEAILLEMSFVLAEGFAAFEAAGLGKQKDYCEKVGKSLGRSSSSVWTYLKAASSAEAIGITAAEATEKGITVGMLSKLRQVKPETAKRILRRQGLTEQKVSASVDRAKASGTTPDDEAEAEQKATDALGRKLSEAFGKAYNALPDEADAGTVMLAVVDVLADAGLFKVPGKRIHNAIRTLVNELQAAEADVEAEAEADGIVVTQ